MSGKRPEKATPSLDSLRRIADEGDNDIRLTTTDGDVEGTDPAADAPADGSSPTRRDFLKTSMAAALSSAFAGQMAMAQGRGRGNGQGSGGGADR